MIVLDGHCLTKREMKELHRSGSAGKSHRHGWVSRAAAGAALRFDHSFITARKQSWLLPRTQSEGIPEKREQKAVSDSATVRSPRRIIRLQKTEKHLSMYKLPFVNLNRTI